MASVLPPPTLFLSFNLNKNQPLYECAYMYVYLYVYVEGNL